MPCSRASLTSFLSQPVLTHNLKTRDRPQFRRVNTVSVALDSIVNAFVHESQETLTFFITVYVHEAQDSWHTSIKKGFLSSLALHKAFKNWGNRIPLTCTFDRKGMFHIYLQSSKLAWNRAWLVPVIQLILLEDKNSLLGYLKFLIKFPGRLNIFGSIYEFRRKK